MPPSFISCSIIVPLMLRFSVSSIHYGMTLLTCHWALRWLCQQEMYFCVSLLRSGCLLICWQSLGWHILLVCLAYLGYWILCRKDVFFALFFLLTSHSHDSVPAPIIGKRLDSSLMEHLTSGGRTLPVIHNRHKLEDKSTIKQKNKHLKNQQQDWTYFWSYSAFTVMSAFWTFSKRKLLLL